jgi:hypothetical protein
LPNPAIAGGKRTSPLTPPCLLRKLPILEMIGNWYGIKISLLFATLSQKYLLNIFILAIIYLYFCLNVAIAGAWGG